MMKRLLKLNLLALSLIGFEKTIDAQTISSHYFGVNAWMPDTIGDYYNCTEPPCYKNGKLHKQWEKIKDSKASIVRYGGIAPDQNKPTKFQYLRVIDSIRAKGMEPVMQVSFWNFRYTAQEAADLVHYVNVIKGRNVKYWIIANEPNLMYNYTTAAQVAAYFKPFASAMKNADPNILIVGPETASFKKTIIDGLTTPGGPDDITGKDAAGRYYVDVISFHTYPMQDGLGTRAEAITKLTSVGNLQDNLAYLNTRISNCNTFHNRSGTATLKSAVTETNVNYNNGPSDDVYGIGANSFFGGQFVCEIYGIGLKNGVDFINLWSVMEGGSSVINNGGFLDGVTGNKKPLYYHFQMMAGAFKGTSVNATTNQTNVKSFACKNGQETIVMILNEDLTNNFNYTVRLNTAAASGLNPLKINVNSNIAAEHSAVIPNQSTLLLTFDASGALIKKTEYSLQNHAIAGLPPTTTTITALAPVVCNTPSGLNASGISPNTATLNWLSTGAANYNVQYKATGSAVWTTVNTTATSLSISGLTAATAYEFQVAGVCSSSLSSGFSVSTAFTTTGLCNAPGGLNVTSIASVTATLNWASSGASSYNVRYKTAVSAYWTTKTTTSLTQNIYGLLPGTAYELQVMGVCSPTSSSVYSVSMPFTTAPSVCNVPAGLNTSLVAASAATLNWTSSGAANYNVRYKTVASTTWITLNSTATSIAILGLSASTAYEFQVAGVCSSFLSSAYSPSSTFTTTAPVCSIPGGLNVSSIASVTATLNWASSGAASYNVRYKTAVSAYWTTKTTTSLAQNIYGLLPGTAYEFQVMGVCSPTSSSVYSVSIPFTTAPSVCNVPTGLNTTLVTASSATLNWTSSGAINYNVRYKAVTAATWSTINTTLATLVIAGLTDSTVYEFQVSGNCSGSSSLYSASTFFTTASTSMVVIGTATLSTHAVPYAAASMKEHAQIIITQAELLASGYNPATNILQSLSFYMNGSAQQMLNNFTIKILHISSSAFSNNSFISTSGALTVYSANHLTAAAGINKHLFSTPFIYNGTGNLLVDLSWNNTAVAANAPVKCTPTTSYRTLYFTTNKKTLNLSKVHTGTLSFDRPNVCLEFSGASRWMTDIVEQQLETEVPSASFELDMNVFPNPAINNFNISFNSLKGESAKVLIYNIVGSLVEVVNFTAETTGKQLISLDFNSNIKLNSLPPGTYICCLDANGKRTSKNFILVK